jgi:excinuclease UvrABC ATPase subunit
VIKHNLETIKTPDRIIDPGIGDDGGEIVAAGRRRIS